MFFTGSPVALRQLRRTQPVCQRVMPLRTYSLSVCSTTLHGRFSASNAAAAAVSSMRLLVVLGSAPLSSRSWPRVRRMAPQPPGPGFGLQPPSVQISTWSRGSDAPRGSDSIGMLVGRRHVEAQPAQILDRVFSGDQRARRRVDPVVQAGEQEADGRPLT